jgi:hypothetical protein
MRPRILYELSQQLATLLEDGVRGSSRVPVFLCHPLDPSDVSEDLASRTIGVLYPVRISPDLRYRQVGRAIDAGRAGRPRDRLRHPALWVCVRYVFLVVGGPMEVQLEVVAAALRTLHDSSTVTLEDDSPQAGPPAGEPGPHREPGPHSLAGETGESGSFPVRIVDDPEGWRTLGLAEHRFTVSFEVSVPILSTKVEEVDRVLDREILFDRSVHFDADEGTS